MILTYLKLFEVVDEYVGKPKVISEVKIYCHPFRTEIKWHNTNVQQMYFNPPRCVGIVLQSGLIPLKAEVNT